MEGIPGEAILISGFLGAGKTTLMRNILNWPGDLSKTAVLVNEFGKIGIDGQRLQGFGTPVVELTNGCICCSIQGDLLRTLEEILDRYLPTRLLIEATGVADPYEILSLLGRPKFDKRMIVRSVVTVVDADFWEGREYLGPLFYNQIRAADLVLFNKVDLLPRENVPQGLRQVQELNPACSVVPTYHCRLDPDVLFTSASNEPRSKELAASEEPLYPDPARDVGYVAFDFEAALPFVEERFRRFMATLPAELYRVKGFARMEERGFFVNHVGGKTQWVDLEEAGRTRLAFVGWEVEEQAILGELRACLHPAKADGIG